MSEDPVTGCPTVPSNNTADPPDTTQAPVGVEPLTLFVQVRNPRIPPYARIAWPVNSRSLDA